MKGLTSHGHNARQQRRRRRTRHARPIQIQNHSFRDGLYAGPARAVTEITRVMLGHVMRDMIGVIVDCLDNPPPITFLADVVLGNNVVGSHTVTVPPSLAHEPGPGEVRCAVCKKISPLLTGEAELEAELREEFPGFGPADCEIVCDACYHLATANLPMMRPR